jgi:hypothetical protein
LRNCVESVLDRDNECSDFSEDETESEVSSIGNGDESSDEDTDDKNDDAPGPSKRVRTAQKKQRDWKWTKTDKPLICPSIENSGICDDLLSKFEAEPPSELSIFLNIWNLCLKKFVTRPVSTQECS